ncbi:MAG: hypothetical protein GX237_10530 [Clostridiales bacterium]|nr:hypothetical protein [Clostridiales bacterium]
MSIKQTVFQLNGEDYGMDVVDVSTVEKDLRIRRLADSPINYSIDSAKKLKNVKGKVTLRGEEMPVYSLRRKFGFEEKMVDEETRYLIANVKGKTVAIEVDLVKGISDVGASDIYEVPTIIKNKKTSYVKSLANINDNLVIILDGNGILDEEELKALEDYIIN